MRCRSARSNLFAGTSARDGHRPVAMSGGEEFVVRAPGPCANTARMGYVRGQPTCVGVPELDGTILSPGSHARTVGAESHGPDRRFVPPENMEFPPGVCLPDTNRSVVATCGQLTAVRAP